LIRTVDYIADAGGYRAKINTNEPGTETSAPADAIINAKPIKVAVVAPKLVAPRLVAPKLVASQQYLPYLAPPAPVIAAPLLAPKPLLALNPWAQQKWI